MPGRDLEFQFTVEVLPDGKPVTAEELERIIISELEDSGGLSKQALWNLATLYSQTDRHDRAFDCIQRLAALADDADQRASCVLAMGQLQEQVGDYAQAVRYYRLGAETASETSPSWYWINNNLGYSLNQLGRYDEAEPHLRAAVAIDPTRPNAFKNLGLALQGQHAYAQAVGCFVRATQANAADPRSLAHLEELVTAHPELLLEVPDLRDTLEACRKAVHAATTAQPDFEAHWARLRQIKPN